MITAQLSGKSTKLRYLFPAFARPTSRRLRGRLVSSWAQMRAILFGLAGFAAAARLFVPSAPSPASVFMKSEILSELGIHEQTKKE